MSRVANAQKFSMFENHFKGFFEEAMERYGNFTGILFAFEAIQKAIGQIIGNEENDTDLDSEPGFDLDRALADTNSLLMPAPEDVEKILLAIDKRIHYNLSERLELHRSSVQRWTNVGPDNGIDYFSLCFLRYLYHYAVGPYNQEFLDDLISAQHALRQGEVRFTDTLMIQNPQTGEILLHDEHRDHPLIVEMEEQLVTHISIVFAKLRNFD